jgi:hypothetical protein
MTDLITEARELCELRRKQKHIPMSMLDKMLELCDALERRKNAYRCWRALDIGGRLFYISKRKMV